MNRWQLTAALLAGALAFWGLSVAWRRVAEHGMNPGPPNLKAQAMLRKSRAMRDVLDAMIRGRLDRVEASAARMRRFASGIDGFLATDVYEKYGDDFYTALDDLQDAANQKDQGAAKDAVLRLEKSCIECHLLINQPER